VLNARLGVTIGKLDLSLFANNVLNRIRYWTVFMLLR